VPSARLLLLTLDTVAFTTVTTGEAKPDLRCSELNMAGMRRQAPWREFGLRRDVI
jgi:hypothetical protein